MSPTQSRSHCATKGQHLPANGNEQATRLAINICNFRAVCRFCSHNTSVFFENFFQVLDRPNDFVTQAQGMRRSAARPAYMWQNSSRVYLDFSLPHTNPWPNTDPFSNWELTLVVPYTDISIGVLLNQYNLITYSNSSLRGLSFMPYLQSVIRKKNDLRKSTAFISSLALI